MFFNLATFFGDPKPSREIADPKSPREIGARKVFSIHPVQLSRWLDEVWAAAGRPPLIPGPEGDLRFFDPEVLGALDPPTQPSPPFLAPSGINRDGPHDWNGLPAPQELTCPPVFWHHLIYAYLIESTGIVEIFAEVIRRLTTGESLGTLRPDSISWARTTEQLFFRPPPNFSVTDVLSEVRPYERANRRNAYWRMFGMDLAHPVPPQWAGSGPLTDWKAHTGAGVNSDFRQKWTELLRQVWLGVENRANTSGANPADPSFIALLSRALKDMLRNRRRGGALAREEFAYVAMLSWFHLTVAEDTSIVEDLQAKASSPADRLAAIAQRVGMQPAARSRELFELAEPMSHILRSVELGLFDTEVTAATLFLPGSALAGDVVNVINNWQSATGERVKERPTGTVTGGAQPLRVPVPGVPAGPAPTPTGSASANGHGR
ncbi:hypothetical protein [Streptomyces sp. NBC_00658]|uniref:hypothetical protein n=1 Tax=Streptomyces sp. NBC_00658 TaxID=2975800 RepID=UPI003253E561